MCKIIYDPTIFIKTDTYNEPVEDKKYNYLVSIGWYISNTKDPERVGMNSMGLYDYVNFTGDSLYDISCV